MPLVIGVVACAFSCIFLLATHLAPSPSAADVAARCKRSPMTVEARNRFLSDWAAGITALLVGYALLTGIRSVRDLYSKQIFAAALGEEGGEREERGKGEEGGERGEG